MEPGKSFQPFPAGFMLGQRVKSPVETITSHYCSDLGWNLSNAFFNFVTLDNVRYGSKMSLKRSCLAGFVPDAAVFRGGALGK
jgi:hypothetical protein